MADKARRQTDAMLSSMEKRLKVTYETSRKDLQEKWDKYMKSHEKKLDDAHDALEIAMSSGDADAIKAAKTEYERVARNITLNNDRYKSMVDDVTAKMHDVNQIATDYINGKIPKIYTINYNQLANENIAGYSFSLINERAVKTLMENDDMQLYKHVRKDKDVAWNKKYINSQVTQGILQGESIPQIAKRIFPSVNVNGGLLKRNYDSSVRVARTMTTAAENKGRTDSFKKAQDDGVILEREWIATFDDRTRAWHGDLHGVRVGVDEPWQNDYGEIMFPGDPTAAAGNVYNCRCSIRAHIKGFKWNEELKEQSEKPDDILIDIKSKLDFDDLDFQTLVNAKKEAGFDGNNWNFFKEYQSGNIDSKILDDILLRTNKVEEHKTIQGKDISNIWTRRSKEFDFAIDDILNAQGFDGLPQVVMSDEFDKLAKESNFIMQRTYSAPSQEILNEYRDQLYNGKWYVDCSKGGAAYGEGMYTFSANSATVTDGIKKNINAFRSQEHVTTEKLNRVETMTFTKDAKIISTDDLLTMFENEAEEYAKKNSLDYFDAEDILAKKFYNRHDESEYIIDLGVYGSAKGYDAVTSNDVTVVLNRTKVIIKGE